MKEYKISKDNRLLLKNTSRTLYLSFVILPDYIKYMLGFAYLIARALDSVVDCPCVDAATKERLLRIFLDTGSSKFSNEISELKKIVMPELDNLWERRLIDSIENIVDEFWAGSDDDDKKMIRALIRGLTRGMMMDIKYFPDKEKIRSIKTSKELIKYSNLIGGVPAIYWYRVYQKYSPNIYKDNVLRSAFRIGTALQLTNILKDIHSDLKTGRLYIPDDFLKSVALLPQDLIDAKNIDKIRPFINSIIITCIDYFDEAELFINSIKSSHLPMKLALIWPIYWAMDSLYLVSVSNPLRSRIKINREKIYKTLIKSPFLLSSTGFNQGYRFRREMIILSVSSYVNR
jgi:phytoene/squalene synthetase